MILDFEEIEIAPLLVDGEVEIDYHTEYDEQPSRYDYSRESIIWKGYRYPVVNGVNVLSYQFTGPDGEVTPEKAIQMIIAHSPESQKIIDKKGIEALIAANIESDEKLMKYYEKQIEEDLCERDEQYE